ncbi:MAG TPA: hypothetical protein VEU29_01370 [Actinomycetota bacterium]|nr:hypothetical protein [Actinomycetota bacterium]
MTNRKKRFALVAVLALACLHVAGSAGPAAAAAQTYQTEVEFSPEHPCTHEIVEGELRVKWTIVTQDNPDGTMKVTIHQHTHGQQLLGLFSQDWYVFNGAENVHEEFTLLGPSGSVVTKTVFVHTSEDLAFQEEPGLDDFHQRFTVTFSPLGPPVVTAFTAECK